MNPEQVWERTRHVFRAMFDDAALELTAGTTAADVEGWDSVSNIALMVALEAEFGVRFNTGEMAGLGDVGQLVERIQQRLAR